MSNNLIEINIGNFKDNLKAIRAHIDASNQSIKFCLPVKADAYGHGIIPIAKAAEEFVDYFGVACLEEGQLLRQNNINKPILVFGAFSDEDIAGLVNNTLEITILSKQKAEKLVKFCQINNLKCKVHIKIDTGMGRVGVRVESSRDLIDYVIHEQTLQLVGLYSHLASSDEDDVGFTEFQINQFKKIVAYAKNIKPNITCHIANSGAVCDYPESYFDMIRPGILSYGYFPRNKIMSGALSNIKPFYTLKSKVVFFKTMERNKSISYNRTYFTQNFTRVVTLPIGYGDGYRRILSNTGNVIIHSKKYTISGTICMDMLMVDIGPQGEAYVGDEVILIGTQGNEIITIEDLAAKCHTNVYEILCGFTSRVPKKYI